MQALLAIRGQDLAGCGLSSCQVTRSAREPVGERDQQRPVEALGWCPVGQLPCGCAGFLVVTSDDQDFDTKPSGLAPIGMLSEPATGDRLVGIGESPMSARKRARSVSYSQA